MSLKKAYLVCRRSFSLLEILVVITILASISTVVGIKLLASVRERTFQENFKLLNDKVKQVKKLAKITQGGVTLILEKRDEKIFISCDGEALPNTQLKKVLLLKQHLDGIATIRLLHSEQSVCELPLTLTFYQSGNCHIHSEADSTVQLEVVPAYSYMQSRYIEVSQKDDAEVLREGQEQYPTR